MCRRISNQTHDPEHIVLLGGNFACMPLCGMVSLARFKRESRAGFLRGLFALSGGAMCFEGERKGWIDASQRGVRSRRT